MGQHLLCTWLLNIELQKWIILLFQLRRLAHPNTIGFTVTLVLRSASHSPERERKCTRLATWMPFKGWFSGSQHRHASSLPSSFYTIYGQRGMAPGRTVNPCGSETSLFINEGSLLGLALLPSNPWHLKSWQHSSVLTLELHGLFPDCHIDVARAGALCCTWSIWIESPSWPCLSVELPLLLGPRMVLWGSRWGWYCLH